MFEISLFEDINISSKESDKKLISKLGNKRVSSNKGNTIKDKIGLLQREVDNHLTFLYDVTEECRSEERFKSFIDNFIKQDKGTIDTETLGVDYSKDKIFGFSMFAEGDKSIYVPVLHKGYVTGQLLDNQIDKSIIKEQFERIRDSNIKLIYHNGKFDIHMIYHNFGVLLPCYWDTMIASRLLHSAEQDHSLKYQYAVKVKGDLNKSYDFKSLFEGIPPEMVPIKIMTPYAAGDTFETMELQRYQENEFKKYPGIYNIFRLEMRVLPMIIQMEEDGVCIDKNELLRLEDKYSTKLRLITNECYNELEKYKDKITRYRIQHPGKLDNPINLSSPAQLSIVIYDIIGIAESQKYKRSTSKKALDLVADKSPFIKKLLEAKTVEKLVTTFIKKLPQHIMEDGKIHSDFIQVKGTGNTNEEDEDSGADTGRFACIAEGQKVQVVNGYKNIEDIEIGDYVYCYDEYGKIQTARVTNKFDNGIRECIRTVFIDNVFNISTLNSTPEHQIYTTDRWVEAKNINNSHVIYGSKIDSKSLYAIKNTYTLLNQEPIGYKHVYDLEVETYHNFIVSEICVHNCKMPNLQQIPSKGEGVEIRRMFRASPGYIMFSSDYSQQEPRVLAHCSQDAEMIEAYKEGKDLYSIMASKIYKKPYEDCLEFYPEGTKIIIDGKEIICKAKEHTNKEGKKIRKAVKSILLGLMYGRGQASIAEQIGSSLDEAKELIDTFYNSFPKIKKWMEKVENSCKKNGYVDTLGGRRRELPDALLPEYDFKNKGGRPKEFNPLEFNINKEEKIDYTVDEETKRYYINKIKRAYGWKGREEVYNEAKSEGIEIKDNSDRLATAMRQSVNTTIQGNRNVSPYTINTITQWCA